MFFNTSVSKSWCTLISYPYCRVRLLQNQSDDEPSPPLVTTLFFVITTGREQLKEYITISKQIRRLDFSLSRLLHLTKEPVVVATYNDLILCCKTRRRQRNYYICNPYTKQWVALPPASKCQANVHVGFICDSYHRCKVVRINKFEENPALQFKVEIFSSDTGEWRESIVLCPRGIAYKDIILRPAVAYNESLYWLCFSGSLIGFDVPSKSNNFTSICQSIAEPHVDDNLINIVLLVVDFLPAKQLWKV